MSIDDLKHLPEVIRHEIIAYLASNNFKAAKALYDKWFTSSSQDKDDDLDFEGEGS